MVGNRAKLLPKMLEYVSLEHQFLAHRYIDLLIHWTAENQTPAALELTQELVKLVPDSQSNDNQNQPKKESGKLVNTFQVYATR